MNAYMRAYTRQFYWFCFAHSVVAVVFCKQRKFVTIQKFSANKKWMRMHVAEQKHAHVRAAHKGNTHTHTHQIPPWVHDHLCNPLTKQCNEWKSHHFLGFSFLFDACRWEQKGMSESKRMDERARATIFILVLCAAFFASYLLHTHVLHQNL